MQYSNNFFAMEPNRQMNMQQNIQPNMQPSMNQMSNQSQTVKYKTQLCRHHKNGNCNLQYTCHFAHGIHELRSFTDPAPNSIPQIQPKVQPSNFKTIMCKYYAQGYCKNTANCTFAHGGEDVISTEQVVQPYNFPMNIQPQIQQQIITQQQHQQVQQQIPQLPTNTSNTTSSDINTQILILILQNMERIFPNNEYIINQLKMSQKAALLGQQQRATQIIMEIMEDKSRTEQEKKDYQKIYTNANIYYNDLISQEQSSNLYGQQPQILQQQQIYQNIQQQNRFPQNYQQPSQQNFHEDIQQQKNNIQNIQQQYQQFQQYDISNRKQH